MNDVSRQPPWLDASNYSLRLLVLSSLLIYPFIRMLLQHEYGFLHFEVLVMGLTLLAVAASLAVVTRWQIAFQATLACLIAITASDGVNAQ